ncbi:helix-turn-helix transcriptional regulator [Vibrio mexicanus]|uniref:helix-turn-helix transcriptional regulator n=1 Tax=Vibrio mexicanus TaxID=1004326 RepID=UPI0009495CBB|nr:helix-turn-helix transcriptional regulator [Vibrio mexicanus]
MDYFCFEKVTTLSPPTKLNFDISKVGHQLGANLVRYRKATGMKQQWMASAFGVSLAQYRKYEKGSEIVKMHAVARWSIITGAPSVLLLLDTQFAPYLMDYNACWDSAPYYCTVSHASDTAFRSLLLLSYEMVGLDPDDIIEDEPSPNIRQALVDIDSHYYVRVAQNMKLIRQHLQLSQEKASELLDISDATYRQYEKKSNSPRIPFTFFAKTHAVFQLRSQWAETGSSDFAKFNRRRHQRLNALLPALKAASNQQRENLIQLFNSVATSLVEKQLSQELEQHAGLNKDEKKPRA